MTTYYVGAGGNNANAGTSWALRKATLDGVEDIPVVAGDTVYCGPAGYTSLTVDVAGTAGNPITYIADVTGEHTNGVGGAVRITGTNDEQTVSRANGISAANSRSYRTFRGFTFDAQSGASILLNASSDHWIIEDCTFYYSSGTTSAIQINGTGGNHTIRRCFFQTVAGIQFIHSSTVNDLANVVENCVFIIGGSSSGACVRTDRVGGVTARNCTVLAAEFGFRVQTALAAGQVLTVNNCVISGCNVGLQATVTTEFTEDYNNIFGCAAARTNVTAGSNSVAYPPAFLPNLLTSGFIFPVISPGILGQTSALLRKTGTGTATDDMYGMTRPATASKISWGAIQGTGWARSTTQAHDGTASFNLSDAGEQLIMRIPVTNSQITVSLYVYRQTDYAGTNPQMVIKQAGQANRTTTDGGSATTWNQLSDTFTPAASPPYIEVFLVSNNTATSGSYSIFADTLETTSTQDPGKFDNWMSDYHWLDVQRSGGGAIAGSIFGGEIVR